MGQQSVFIQAVSEQIAIRTHMAKSFVIRSLIGTGTAISMSMGIVITSQAAEIPEIPITVTNQQCEPMHLTVPQGKVRFLIKNKSMRALEWEILNGVMVVAERENIAPGFYQKMTVDLEPGQYQTTCGLLTNPRGTLTVQSSQKQHPYQLKSADTVAISAEYKFYLILTSQSLSAAHEATSHTAAADNNNALTTKQAYYALLAMANAWTAQDTQDRYQTGHADPAKRHQQIMAWKDAARRHTLSVTDILNQLQHSVNKIALGPDRAAGLLADIHKFVTLATPVLRKMDAALVERIDADLTQWQTTDTQAMRHAIAEDLKRMIPYFQQEQ